MKGTAMQFRTLTLAGALALALTGAAFANPGGEHNNTGCNGQGNANSPCSGNTTTTNGGGAGGDAAALSSANAGAVALSGSVSGASAINGPNTNTNIVSGGDSRATVGNVTATAGPSSSSATGGRSDATATLGNLNHFGGEGGNSVVTDFNSQTQVGIQANKQSTDVSNGSSSASAVNNSGNSTNDNRSSATNSATTGASTSGATASGNGAGQTTTINTSYEAQKRNPVSSAYAAPLQIGSLVCGMSKVSGALQLPGVGASGQVGSIDQGCERRSTADVFARLGFGYEACIIMVRDPVAVAAGLTEATCQRPATPVAQALAPAASAPSAPVASMAPIPNPVPVQDGERKPRIPRG